MTVSPSASSSTREWREESDTSRVPVGSGIALPGKRRIVDDGAGGMNGPSPRCSVPFASCSAISSESKMRRFWACRSEEHTSELQSRGHLVCRLLLEKKKCENVLDR